MYIPDPFRQPDDPTHALIAANPFGVLIVEAADRIEAAHLPFVLARAEGRLGTLHGHVARANPICRGFADGGEVLAAVHGANAYISPDWYGTKDQVPTCNYVVAHAY